MQTQTLSPARVGPRHLSPLAGGQACALPNAGPTPKQWARIRERAIDDDGIDRAERQMDRAFAGGELADLCTEEDMRDAETHNPYPAHSQAGAMWGARHRIPVAGATYGDEEGAA